MKKIKKRYFLFIPILILAIVFLVMASKVPDLSVEKITEISQTLTIYDKNNNVSTVLDGGQSRKSISIENVPQHVINALIATEDVRFYQHNGIDVKRIFGALFNDITSGSLKEGASTITQQLIKNSHLSSEKTVLRKFNEALLAIQLERQYGKDQILEMYFNFVYFGRGAYGIQSASQAYFGIDAKDLSVSQGAMLIGVLKAPSKYAPHINMEKAVTRRNVVLSQMKKYGYITEEEYSKLKNEIIEIIEQTEHEDYGYYTDFVLSEGAQLLNISVDDILAGGYNIYTTLDSLLQKNLQEIYEDDDNFFDETVQSATVIIDNVSGGVSAMIGGRTHEGMLLYNRATAKRQPGSTIKPILVFGPAFENKSITPATMIDDYRKNFSDYAPTNYKNVYYGKVTVRQALSLSLNIPAVEILQKNGIENSKNFAEKAGIIFDEEDNHLALALGGMKYGVSPLQIAGAYSMLARKGEYIKPYCVKKITDNNGNVLYERNIKTEKVFSENTAFFLTDILCDVSKQENNAHSKLQNNIASKTGTVGYNENGNSDAWSVGYVPSHTVSVWLGYDKTTENQYLPYEVTGSSYSAKISAKIFEKIFEIYGYDSFEKPSGIIKIKIDNYSLKSEGKIYLASNIQNDVISEYFEKENAPATYNSYWDTPQLPEKIQVQLNEIRQAEISFTPQNNFTEYIIIRKNSVGESVIKTIKGEKDKKITVVDESYTIGDVYIIQPRHSEILVDGKAYMGKRSREFFIN